MRELIRVSSKVCARCKYRIQMEQKAACNYSQVIGHSRIFEHGKMAYAPEFCDKYEPGEMVNPHKDIDLAPSARDEYWDYKYKKIMEERSKYDYKHKRRSVGSGQNNHV